MAATAAGVTVAAHFATWVTALKLTSVASATALVCLQAGSVVLIDRLGGNPVCRSTEQDGWVTSRAAPVSAGRDPDVGSAAPEPIPSR